MKNGWSIMLHPPLSFLKKKYLEFIRDRFLPCTVFCRDPLVLVSYDWDFINCARDFLNCFSKHRA